MMNCNSFNNDLLYFIIFMSDILIKNLDDSCQIVLYTTGVGALAQAHFTLHAGSSKFALESGCFYAMGSL